MRFFTFLKLDNRLDIAKLNILYSFGLKGISVCISLIIVPLTIKCLNANDFGVWLTLSSLIVWIGYFDIGLGNGLRNKLAEAIAVEDYEIGQIYVSTTFALLSIIMCLFFILVIIINPWLDWSAILNTDHKQGIDLSKVVVVVVGFFCLQFVFKTVGIIFVASQKPALSDLINVCGNLLALIGIYILTKTEYSSLGFVALIFSASPVLIMLIAFLFAFNGKYSKLSPKLSLVNFKYTNELMGLGIQFFIIQIAVCVVVYTSTNIIITQLFGPSQVTIYNIAYKYLYSISMVYTIILMPFWSAATDAYVKHDFQWIKLSINKLIYIYIGFLALTLILLVFANRFYIVWVGSNIRVPFILSLFVALYVTLFNWSNTFIYFINGIGKIRLQLYLTLFVAVIYIPLTIYLGRVFGVNGVVISSCISLLPASILMPIQCVKLYSGSAKGIWNK
jgi:O-antigen/teichoic acid export membrane protein